MVAQGLSCFLVPVGGQVVEDDDRAWGDLRNQYLADVGGECGAIHCPLDDPRSDQRVLCQTCDQSLGSPTAKWHIHRQAVPSFRPSTQAREVRLHRGFINEDNAIRQSRNGRKPMFEPVSPLLPYLGATALGGNQRLFWYVNPSRDSRLAIKEWCTCTPSASASASRNSKSVMSGSCAISSSRKG